MPFAVTMQQSAAPYLGVYVKVGNVKKQYFTIPNDYLQSFNISWGMDGMHGELTLMDTYDAGTQAPGNNFLDAFYTSIYASGLLAGQLSFDFGWQNGVKTQEKYSCSINNLTYEITDQGIASTIKFVTGGYDDLESLAVYPYDLPDETALNAVSGLNASVQKVMDLIKKVQTKDVDFYLKRMIDEYNRRMASDNSKLYKEPIYLGDAKENLDKAKAPPVLKVQGMKFFEAINELFKNLVFDSDSDNENRPELKTYVANIISVAYADSIDTKTNTPNMKQIKFLIISALGVSNSTPKRHYYYRAGGYSDVYSISYQDKCPAMAYFAEALNCNIKAMQIDKNNGTMETKEISTEKKSCARVIAHLLRTLGRKVPGITTEMLYGTDKVKRSEDETIYEIWRDNNEKESKSSDDPKKMANIAWVNLSNANWQTADQAGAALMRNIQASIALRSIPEITMEIPGDPYYILGALPRGFKDITLNWGKNETSDTWKTATVENVAKDVEKEIINAYKEIDNRNIKIGDTISITINTPSGYQSFLSGKFTVLGFEHKISDGNYRTVVKALKSDPFP